MRPQATAYKNLMGELKELAADNFNADNLETNLEKYLTLRSNIEQSPTISGTNNAPKIELIRQENEKLKSQLTVTGNSPWAAATIAASITLSAVASIVGFGVAANKVDDENSSANQSLLAMNFFAACSSIVAIVTSYNDYSKNTAETKRLRDSSSDTLKDLAYKLDQEYTRKELDNLMNNLTPQNKIDNPDRVGYWSDFHDNHKNNLNTLTPAQKDEAMNLFYAGAAIASYYSIHPNQDLGKARGFLENNLILMKQYCGITTDLEPSNHELAEALRDTDPRLPTLYARNSYQLGRAVNIEWPHHSFTDQERSELGQHLTNACALREIIDTNPNHYNDDFNSRDIPDSLLFKRSGLWERNLRTLQNEVEKGAIDKKTTSKKLDKLLHEFDKSQHESDRFHNFVCREKMINILSLNSQLNDNDPSKSQEYAKQAKIVLFNLNKASPDNLDKLIKDNTKQERMLLRSAAKLTGILVNAGELLEAETFNNFISSHPNIAKHPEVETECRNNANKIVSLNTPSSSVATPIGLRQRSSQTAVLNMP